MLTLPAYAKINWSLRVLGKRPDGFHEICTVFQTISLSDRLTFEEDGDLRLTCDAPDVPVTEDNLIIRAALALHKRFNIKKGARIHLEKRIPSPGGLGGGSADAAVSLLALSELWEIKTNLSELTGIGKTLGADVPFFLSGGTALGTELGTEIELLPDVPKKLLLIVTPDENVSTREAYKSLDAPLLTKENSKSILKICRVEAQNSDFLHTGLHNDFEAAVFRNYPEIERVRKSLLKLGAASSLMSGSGASVFAIFDKQETRQTALSILSQTEKSWRVFSCETISRPEYQDAFRMFS